jgi:hypothetical protein
MLPRNIRAPLAVQTIRPFSESIQDFPRLASLYGVRTADQAGTLARYGLIVGAGKADAVAAIKSANSRSKVIYYANTSSVTVPGFNGMDIYPGWWLTLVGTRLASRIDATTTTIPVSDPAIIQRSLATNPDLLVDGETMHVLSVNASHGTLTVERAYNSTASSHAIGSRIAAHASKWPHTWLLNVTPYCPVNPRTRQSWVQYAAAEAKRTLTTAPWDGILWDDGNVSFSHLSNGNLDANNDNVADGGDGPSGAGWQDGVKRLLTLTRTLLPGKLQLVTDAYYPGLMDGEQMEHFPYY